MIDTEVLKDGLVIFRRGDVKHDNWYCRMRLFKENRYKTICLDTPILKEARDKAFDEDAELRFKIKHELPVFDRKFSDVAAEYEALQERRMKAGEISPQRFEAIKYYIRPLNAYVGTTQITIIPAAKWGDYALWRRENGKGRFGERVSYGTIRGEMIVALGIQRYAVSKNYIRDSQVFKGALPTSKERREEFTPDEYRKLHTVGRQWVKESKNKLVNWYRTVAYNFILIMCNTGMRPPEAKNLQWRDIGVQTDKHGRQFVHIKVRGKDKYRDLVAPISVFGYFERIRAISPATGDTDNVFTTNKGKPAKSLYASPIEVLLKKSNLLFSSSKSRRTTYCFRHTYATFRLTEGVSEYFLAEQMGTSVKMIEDHYGHINAVKNADRILQGLPGWEPIADAPERSAASAKPGKNRRPSRKKPEPPK